MYVISLEWRDINRWVRRSFRSSSTSDFLLPRLRTKRGERPFVLARWSIGVECAASGPACRHRFWSLQKTAQNALLCLPEAFCIRVCPSVSESLSEWLSQRVQKTLWTPYLKNQWREFHPILLADVFGLMDVLIRFWDQKVKDQGHLQQAMARETGWIQYLCTYWS